MERYRDLFLAEAREHLGAAFELQLALETRPHERSSWKELMRHAHSLKGMAATMGYDSLVNLAHAVEEFLERVDPETDPASQERLPVLADSLACMSRIIDRVEHGAHTGSARAEELASELAGIGVGRNVVLSSPVNEIVPDRSRLSLADASGVVVPCAGAEAALSHWRVDLLLDDHPARSAELTVAVLRELASLGHVVQVDPPRLDLHTGRFEGRLGLLLASGLERRILERELRRLRGLQGCSLSPGQAPPSPAPKEIAQRWVRVRAEQLDALVEGLQELRFEQARLRGGLPSESRATRDRMERAELRLDAIYGDVLELRLVPFDTMAQRVHQAVRETARQLDKQVRFEIVGAQVRLDRSVLDELVDPLLHMVRNALDQGIETREERKAAGKSAQAALALELERRGERVHLRLRDDGRGMRPDALRRAALRAGRFTDEEARRLSCDELLMLTTCPGISTASEVSHFSGRGVGLDVVRSTVERLGGTISIGTEPGRGTWIDLQVPLRMALIQALLVRSGRELYALPMDAELRALKQDCASSRELVRLPSAPDGGSDSTSWIVEIGAGENRLGLAVDEVLGSREIVVKPLPPPLGQLRPYAGATVLEDGAIVLVVDPQQLR